MNKNSYYSNGKLLISGEYLVLDGGLSLAVPTTFGQSLQVEPQTHQKLLWRSLDDQGQLWFETTLEYNGPGQLKASAQDPITQRILDILHSAQQLNPNFLNASQGFKITTSLSFPKHWGLGTSSTLINNMAQWAQVDAYTLLEKTFGGSGYDIACAQHKHPIVYQLINNKPQVEAVSFRPVFRDHIYFVYLNKKQNSREGIAQYRTNKKNRGAAIHQIHAITKQMVTCNALDDFDQLMLQHEQIISEILQQPPVKAVLFPDFKGQVKSLGAWGGDFVMATSIHNPTAYFKTKGFETVIPYETMILNPAP